MIGEDNVIAFRFTLRGRHTGPFAGIPPTGRMVALTGIDFIRISGGQLAELWSSQDTLSWALQLGIVEWAVRQASTETER